MVPEKLSVPATLSANTSVINNVKKNLDIVKALARVTDVIIRPYQGILKNFAAGIELDIEYEATVDVAAERDRLTKEIAKYEKGLISAERQLGNESFLAKAPVQVVEGLRKQEAETRLLREKARAALDNLNKGR